MKNLIVTAILIVLSAPVFAQIPENWKLEKAEDYAMYEDDVINCIDWLADTPLNEQAAKRKEINAFLLQWITGSPYVHIEIRTEIVTFMESSPDLLILYLAGWTRYALTTKNHEDKLGGVMAGLEAVIDFYSENPMEKNKHVEKYIKMKKKGKLKEFVMKHI